MADIAKYAPPTMKGGAFFSEFKAHFSIGRTKRTVSVAYAFVFVFIAFTIFLAFSPSSNSSSPWFANIFTVGARGSGEIGNSPPSSSVFTDESYRSHFSSIYYYFFPNSTTAGSQSQSSASPPLANSPLKSSNITNSPPKLPADQTTAPKPPVNQTANKTTTPPKPSSAKDQGEKSEDKVGVLKGNSSAVSGNGEKGNMVNNPTSPKPSSGKDQGEKSEDKVGVLKGNSSAVSGNEEKGNMVNNSTTSEPSSEKDQGEKSDDKAEVLKGNSSAISGNKEKDNMVNNSTSPKTSSEKDRGEKSDDKVGVLNGNSSAAAGNGEKGNMVNNSTSSSVEKKKQNNANNSNNNNNNNNELIKSLMGCDFFDGNWVKDESYPLYKPDSCSLIDEQFNCFRNGRPDNGYYKLKWKPKGCTLPRLDGSHMLELLRGKRLVFVGDSLNRNMWESLICILRNSVKDQTKVYEENGRHNFRGEASYSFIFKDYKFTVEFFVTPFLVQEWEVEEKNGTKKETLRLDIVSHAASKYKTAEIIVFNTGHWWTHDKTALGKDYYQEGSHVYGDLNVLEAFRKAITTWGRWIDANVDPKKSLVFFRGYSASHFSGGQWNSGGQCDHETEPIKNETYLAHYPTKMAVLEKVLRNMKTRVTYLNVTRMTDYRKDGHPSIYRKLHLTDEEKKSPLRFQDCSHWCLPGVPDAWNEILYAELLVKLKQRRT